MPCVKSGARAGSLYRNLVAHALTLGASGDRAPVRQQPWCLLYVSSAGFVVCIMQNIICSTCYSVLSVWTYKILRHFIFPPRQSRQDM